MKLSVYKQTFKGDLTGGLTAAILALPMGLAFGLQSGLGPQAGLYTAIILAIVAFIIAGTKTLISDPTGPMTFLAAVIIAGAIEKYAPGQDISDPFSIPKVAALIVLTFALTGVFQALFGLIKVANYVKYISYPVLSGFMSGIGVIIILTQWHSFFDAPRPSGGIISIISDIHTPFMEINFAPMILGVSTIAIIYLMPYISKKIPAGLVALVGGTLISLLFAQGDFKTIGEIPTTLPEFRLFDMLANVDSEMVSLAIGNALALAGLGTIDTLLTSVVADNLTKTKHNGNRELFGQGLGNFLTGVLGGIPGAGTTAATVANINSNGRSNLSGILKGVFLIIAILGLGKILAMVPKSVLSALLISVGIGIIDFKGMKRLIRLKNSDSLVLILAIILTVFVDLLVAVGVGMVLSSFFFMQRMGKIVDEQSKQGNIADMEKKLKIPESIRDRIFEYELDGPLFYGFSDQFKEQAESISGKDAVIINMSHVPYIDASGIYVLEEVIQSYRTKHIEVILVGVKDHIFKQFEELKVIPNTLPEEKAYNSVRSGLKYLKFQLENPDA